MTQTSDPKNNAITERVNGVTKNEYRCSYHVSNLEEGKQMLDFVVMFYNEERSHMSLGNLAPSTIHAQKLKPEKLWRNYYHKSGRIVNAFRGNEEFIKLYQDRQI